MSLLDLAHAVDLADGVAPINEASLMALKAGDTPRVLVLETSDDGQLVAAAFAADDSPVEVMVDPTHRRQGWGRRIVTSLVADGEDSFWAHGDLPPARALAASLGLVPERTLLVLRLAFDGPPQAAEPPKGVTFRTFRPADAEALIDVNARAFAAHPEQGAMDAADFNRRMASRWFDPAGLFIAERDGQIVGFHWTKIEHEVGEVYVVGIDPDAQGGGLGTALTARGLEHLHATGVPVVDLYVEGDNVPALAVYHRLGFTEHAKDVLYSVS